MAKEGLIWLYLLGFGFMAVSLEPGFLDFDNLPDTNFSCVGKVIGGYYADLETNCQMFHVCTIGQLDEPMDIRFLCLNGTVFDQETRVCERIDEVDCSKSEQFYSLNLELYGNTQPAILEESSETEQPLIIKSTTATTTTTQAPRPKTSRTPYYTTITSPTVTTASNPQVISTHHFPVVNSPDIRFNPEEINISLHPGAPPDIRTKPVTFHQQRYSENNKKVVVTTHSENSDNKKVSVTTHSAVFDEAKVLPNQEQGLIERPQIKVSSTQNPHSAHSYGHSHGNNNKKFNHPTPSDINYEFGYHQTEPSAEYHTDVPQNYHYQSNFRPSQEYSGHHHNHHNQPFKSSTYQNEYTPTTSKVNNNYQHKAPTTLRNYFLQSLKPPAPVQHYIRPHSESPQRLQLPLPLLPTLPPLTFSSPAPFSLQHHIETKRYTKDHQAPPRIIISASASVSDASGRRLNYSLGTIGAAEILEQPPQSYDEYKDDDVGLDPFYHDVPKIKHSRRKRDADEKIKHSDIIRSEQEAVDVLKFLFDWYKNNEKTATESTTIPTLTLTDTISPQLITQINDELSSLVSTENNEPSDISEETRNADNFHDSDLFNKNSKYSIIGNKSNDENLKESEINSHNDEENVSTKQDVPLGNVFPSNSSENSTKRNLFIDELFHHEEDYVNDNFEPIAYSELYGKSQQSYVKEDSRPLVEVEKHRDDHIKPIYFRPEIESVNNNEKENDANVETTTSIIIEQDPVTENLNISNQIYSKGNASKSLELNETGDKETNKYNKKEETFKEILPTPNEVTTVETIANVSSEVNHNSEPKSELLEAITTEKPTTKRSRSDRRRGRRRFSKSHEKEKEHGNKNVVLEKITEKAHTAKDDFNYLRTLYKVHTTTPMGDASDSKEVKNKGRHTATRVEQTNSEELKGDNFDIQNIMTTSSEELINMTTEANAVLIHEQKSTEAEDIAPIVTTEINITTTTKKPVASRRSERRRGRSRYNTDTNQKQSSPRKHHSRRKSTTSKPSVQVKINETLSSDTESTGLRPPNNTDEIVNSQNSDNNKLNEILNADVNHSKNVSEDNSDTRSNNTIEKYSSNISSSFVPYSEITDITTDHIKTLAEQSKSPMDENRSQFIDQLTVNFKQLFEDIGKSNDSSDESVETDETSHYISTESLDLVEGNKVKNESTTAEPPHEDESEDNSPNLTLASSDAVYVPHVEIQEESTTAENHLEIQDTNTLANLSEVYKEAVPEGFISTIPKNIREDSEDPSTLIKDIENYDNLEAEVPKIIEEAPIVELSTEKQQETESYTTTLIREIITETPKYLENFKLEHNQVAVNMSAGQHNTESPLEKISLVNNEYSQVTENIPTTQLTTEEPQFNHLEENNYDYSSLPKTSSPKDDEFPLLDMREPDVMSTTEQINTGVSYTTEYYPSSLIQEITESIINVEPTKFEDKVTEEIPTTQLTTERLQKIIEGVEVATKSTIDITDISLNIESEIGEVKHFDSGDDLDTNKIIGTSTKENIATTERVENLEDLINEIQNTTKSLTATTITTELSTPIIEMTKQDIEGVEATLELTTLHPNQYEEKTVIIETTVNTESLPTSQGDIVTTTEQPAITTEQPTIEKTLATTGTTRETTSISNRGNRRGTRPSRRRTTNNFNRSVTRHRFSTEAFTRRPGRRRTTIEEQIVDELTKNSRESTTEPLWHTNNNKIKNDVVEEFATYAPLQKSVSPTQAERVRESLPTTPFSKTKNVRKFYIFNCFGKQVDKFYPDPRDCRLFHYCTQGYNKNQLLDMKFVCDFNTYFDDEKLICTKKKPKRCL